MTKNEEFWQWFVDNARAFKHRDHPAREALSDELFDRLQQFADALSFEMGILKDGSGHLIITAQGDTAAFPTVVALAQAAPAIEGWEITAFKPPRGFGFILKRSGLTVDPRQARFVPLEDADDRDFFGVHVGYPHYEAEREEDFLDATCTMLETGIGELDFAERIHHVQVGPLPDDPEADGHLPLDRLRDFLPERGPH